MPHLYSDRCSKEEEIQKLLHMELLRRILAAIPAEGGRPQPATWEAVESTAMLMSSGVPVLKLARFEATAQVAAVRKDNTSVVVFGTSKPMRKQFAVSVLAKSRRVQVTPVGARSSVAHGVETSPEPAGQEVGAPQHDIPQ